MIESGSLAGKARRLISCFFAMALVVVVGRGSPAHGTIINVPADQPSIQAGIEFAMSGDTVLVAPGRYYENIDFRSKEIVVSSHFMLDQDPHHIFNTIIDGSQPIHSDSAGCVRILCTGSEAPVLQGFNLTGGTGTEYYDSFESTRYNHGGGVGTDGGAPIIQYNYIHDNISDPGRPMGGGGMFLQRGLPVVTNNIVVHNNARYGCGIGVSYASPVFRNNIIAYNSGGSLYGGGGIYQWQGYGLYENNTVAYNNSIMGGGGIKIYQANGIVRNSIVWGNTGSLAPDFYLRSSNVTVEYCAFPSADTGIGNISTDPMFVGDWFYTPLSSPCVDAGSPWPEFNDPASPSAPTSARWPSHAGLTNDMGAWGGPDRFPFEFIAIYADPRVNWGPTEVNFSAESYFDAESWAWNFGDGNEATGETPANMYNHSGLYDVTVTVTYDGSEEYSHTREGLVAILADSLIGGDVASEHTENIAFAVDAITTVPIAEITVPIEYSGDLDLVYDSFSTAGCRPELFEMQEILDSSAVGKQLTIKLTGSSAMAAGSGPVLKLYFSHLGTAVLDQQSVIALDGYAEYEPRFSGEYADYVPLIENGSITYEFCCQGMRGNANDDTDDKVNISDVSYLLAYLFGIPTGPAPPCPQEGNANGDPDEKVNISDVSYLLAYLFGIPTGPEPPMCPPGQ